MYHFVLNNVLNKSVIELIIKFNGSYYYTNHQNKVITNMF